MDHPLNQALAASGVVTGLLGWVGIVQPVIALIVSVLAGAYYISVLIEKHRGKP